MTVMESVVVQTTRAAAGAGALIAAAPIVEPDSSELTWAFRTLLFGCLGVIAWFGKKWVDRIEASIEKLGDGVDEAKAGTEKFTAPVANALARVEALETLGEVGLQWISDSMDRTQHPHRRRTDELLRKISHLLEEEANAR